MDFSRPRTALKRAQLVATVVVLSTSGGVVASLIAAQLNSAPVPSVSWNPQAAAGYLDGRMIWWLGWSDAARDHGTTCVSCHTALPYALARPALRAALGERQAPEPERRLIENVAKRVQLWSEVEPYYEDRSFRDVVVARIKELQSGELPKDVESRGTEAVLNALILARRDAEGGSLSDDARHAFTNLWALQFRAGDQKGAWAWLNFHNEPWEANDSPYFGAALAAIAVGSAPSGYASSSGIQDQLKLLREYLQQRADTVSLFNRVMVLWASGEMPGLLTPVQREAIIDSAISKQQDDGGWVMSTLGPWKRRDGSALEATSDGVATGLVLLALERAGLPRTDVHVRKGLDWLMRHQDPATGMWFASSLNKSRTLSSTVGKFMSDAATAYAVLALTQRP